EEVVAGVVEAAFLFGVPVFGGDPAGALGGEAQAGGLQFAAGEDAVAGAEDGVEGLRGYVLRGAFEQFDMADAVDGEVAQVVTQVAPGVEVPVLAIVDEALGGDVALGFLALAAGVVADVEPLAAQQGGADVFEVVELH